MSPKLVNLKESLLTRKDVARRLSVHSNSIKRWQRDGRISAVVINSRVVRYEESEVERLIKESRLTEHSAGGAR
ncbi:helix-turn-helix domain-containing protein [Horticoccus sp. 23ND18S-11]